MVGMNDLEQTICKRCGRKLRKPEYIKLGMGATCWKKYISQDSHKRLFEVSEEEKNVKCEI